MKLQRLIALISAGVFIATVSGDSSLAAGNYSITYTNLTPPSSLGGDLQFTTGNRQGGSLDAHATVWSGPSYTRVDFHPAGASSSYIDAGAGNQFVGGVYQNGAYSAALWNGTPSSYVNLNPAGSANSQAIDTDGARQAGYVQLGFQVHAGFWSGTAASFVDLDPGSGSSIAWAIAGNRQGGVVNYNGFGHAALWSGTAASFTDLTPASVPFGYHSEILAMTSNQQAGYAGDHAGIWFGTAASFVDLHPTNAAWSEAHDTIDTMQAGFAVFEAFSSRHALLWFGSATNYIDLQLALSPTYVESQAESVWTEGNTIFVAGSARDFPGYSYPMLWKLTVPEPAAPALFGLALGTFAITKRKVRRLEAKG